jgi:hypothetical protein
LQNSEGRIQKVEFRRQFAEGCFAEFRRQNSEGRIQKAEFRKQFAENKLKYL